LKLWEQENYESVIADEWFALGMLDPAKYDSKNAWIKALTLERQVKDYIYQQRREYAEDNRYFDDKHGIFKQLAGYVPLSWNDTQAQAFDKFNCHPSDFNYMYSPLDTDNIDKFYFNKTTADIWCESIEKFIMHVEGDLGNERVLLTVEQRAFFRNLFGWKFRLTDLRRYAEVFK